MRNGNPRNMEDQMCDILGQLSISTSRQEPSRKTSPANYSIPSTFRMDGKFKKISPSTDSTVPISRMDMGLDNNDSSITSRQMSENIKRIKNCEEKNLQKEDNFCMNSSNFDWDAFRYKNTIP
jgi:hypothetical protein